MKLTIRHNFSAIMIFTMGVAFSYNVTALEIDIYNTPLYLGSSVEPNIMFTLDDSGSMHWEEMPIAETAFQFPRADGIYGANDYANDPPHPAADNDYFCRGRSTAFNSVAYNPKVYYKPWAKADGTFFPNADPHNAYHNPYNTAAGARDLEVSTTETAAWRLRPGISLAEAIAIAGVSGGNYSMSNDYLRDNGGRVFYDVQNYYPAIYYNYKDPEGDVRQCVNHDRIEIRPANAPFVGGYDREDCADPLACSYDEEMQNFANWYSYYRSRVLLARGGIGHAFARQSTSMRVGFAAINEGHHHIDDYSSPGTIIRGVRPFENVFTDDGNGNDSSTLDNYRDQFFDDLYGHVMIPSGTPLRQATDDVGQYFMYDGVKGPWSETPGMVGQMDDGNGGTRDEVISDQNSCRQNYHILMTDGQWNGAQARHSDRRANVDDSDGPVIPATVNPPHDAYHYTAAAPYNDEFSNTLADVAMYYWLNDLRPDMNNNVVVNPKDEAFWQHMVNFTVGLGVIGSLDYTEPQTLADLESGALSWPNPTANILNYTDDLWHAAVNSRGNFFSADNPDDFADALAKSLADIVSRKGSSAAVTSNAGEVGGSNTLFQVVFDSDSWTGFLRAYEIDTNTGEIDFTSPLYEAGLPGSYIETNQTADSRKIITYDPTLAAGSRGIPFRGTSLNEAQLKLLNINPNVVQPLSDDGSYPLVDGRNEERIRFIRGEENITGFRLRTSKLGDFINSAPVLVGTSRNAYPDDMETVVHSTFVNTTQSRTKVVYVGANDGMLHGFRAGDSSADAGDGGEELMAYVPNSLIHKLNLLPDTRYTSNHQYFVDGSPSVSDAFWGGAWHSALVAGLNGGGQGIYALDVSTPLISEAMAANVVLWEFTDADDSDLGYTYSQPLIVKLNNGEWAAVFGNGYNNTEADGPSADPTSRASTTGNAVLYIVNIETGALIKKIDTGFGMSRDPEGLSHANGLSSPAAMDIDGDSVVDYIYAGDIFGNLWKFDLTTSVVTSWKVAYKDNSDVPKPFFSAIRGAEVHTISAAPILGNHPNGDDPLVNGQMVYFGTGRYLTTNDNQAVGPGINTETYYGLWDRNLSNTDFNSFERSHLLEQKIEVEALQWVDLDHEVDSDGNGTANDDKDKLWGLRKTTNYEMDGINYSWIEYSSTDLPAAPVAGTPTKKMGWYLDLKLMDDGWLINEGIATQVTAPLNHGEKQIFKARLDKGRIIFATLLPSEEICRPGGNGWIMELDALNGSQLPEAQIDISGDGQFDIDDFIELTSITVFDADPKQPPSGWKVEGIPTTPEILQPEGTPYEMKYISTSTGAIAQFRENPLARGGRISWRQLH